MTHPQGILTQILLPYQQDWVADQSRFKIGMWSRQTGKSFATAAEAVYGCILVPGDTWVILSAGERQALEWMEKAKMWANAFSLVIDSYKETIDPIKKEVTKSIIRFANGSRILSLPANPATARGYTGNLILDEFAIHKNPREIWTAIYSTITNPLRGTKKLRIVSTPKGRGNKFADLWDHNDNYSKHKVTIHDAISAGLNIDAEELRRGLDDPEAWAQEYLCEFIDSSAVLLPYEMIGACEMGTIVDDGQSPLYIGMDIGRSKDLSVIEIGAMVGGVLYTVEEIVLDKMPFHQQLRILCDKITNRVQRVCIDATGIGAMLAEEARRKVGARVQEVKFSTTVKAEIFSLLRRKFEDKLIRIPVNRDLREDLHAMTREAASGGTITYSAPRNADGHSDRASAMALMVKAATATSTTFIPTPFTRRFHF